MPIKASNQVTITNVADGRDSVTVILTDENHTFAADSSGHAAAAAVSTDILAFQGIKRIAAAVGSITGLPAGMTMTVKNNGTASTSVTVAVTSSLTALSGTVNIPITANGVSITKVFSYTLSKAGAAGSAGAPAKAVDLSATSQVFKSSDGGITFSPDTIRLTPVFQGGITFGKWQYSRDGGSSWTDVSGAAHGLTVSSGALTISKTSDLFTRDVTSLSLKCISSDSAYFDVITVLKLYDTADLEIGGRNLALNSRKGWYSASSHVMNGRLSETWVPGAVYTVSLKGSVTGAGLGLWRDLGNTPAAENLSYDETKKIYQATFTCPDPAPGDTDVNTFSVATHPASETVTASVEWIKIERGNHATDWTPAPEDINTQTSLTVLGTQSGVTGNWTGKADLFYLQDGQQITYWLPYNGSGNASLNLTLADGSATGAVPCYYSGSTRLTTQYPANNAIRLIYRQNVSAGSSVISQGWWADANYNADTYDRVKHASPITAKSAITAKKLIVGDNSGYFHLAPSAGFDITKQILYAAGSIAAGATGTNNFTQFPEVDLQATKAGWTGEAKKTCYLVGTLSGTTFTPGSALFTTTEPASEDHLLYISLGYMSGTHKIYLYPQHDIYMYSDNGFKALPQIISETKSTLSGVSSIVNKVDKSITDKVWMTDIDGKISAYDNTTVKTITDKVTSLTTDLSGISSKVSTAETSLRTMDGRVTSLTTRVNSAEQKITDEAITSTVRQYVQIGGVNLLDGTRDFSGMTGGFGYNDGWEDGFAVYYYKNNSGTENENVCVWHDKINIKPNTYYSLSFYACGDGYIDSVLYNSSDSAYNPCINSESLSGGFGSSSSDGRVCHELGSNWARYKMIFKTKEDASGFMTVVPAIMYPTGQIYIYGIKFEEGQIPTAWSPSPNDTDAEISAVQTTASQLSDRFRWIVKSGTSSSNFELTDRTATLAANYINLHGLISFNGLSSETQGKINATPAWITTNGNTLLNLKNMVMKWTDNAISTTTQINGGWIKTNTITAEKIALGDFTNYVTANEALSKSAITGNHPFGSGGDNIFSNGYITKKTSSNAYLALTQYKPNSFNNNDELYYTFTAKGSASGSCTVSVFFCGNRSTDDLTTKVTVSGPTHSLTTAEQTFSGTIKLGSCKNYGYYAICIYDRSTSKIQIYAKNVCVRKKNQGELIVDGSITAEKLAANSITSAKIATDAIKSRNYVSGTSGAYLNLSNGTFDSKYLKWDSNGKLTATAGLIGGWTIDSANNTRLFSQFIHGSDQYTVYLQPMSATHTTSTYSVFVNKNNTIMGGLRTDGHLMTGAGLDVVAGGANISGGLTCNGILNMGSNKIQWNMAGNDSAAIIVRNWGTDNGGLEFCTGDNGNEPIYVSQYSDNDYISNTYTRRAELLDRSGNTKLPGILDVGVSTRVVDYLIAGQGKVYRAVIGSGGTDRVFFSLQKNDGTWLNEFGIYPDHISTTGSMWCNIYKSKANNQSNAVQIHTNYALYVKNYAGTDPQEIIAGKYTTASSEKFKSNISPYQENALSLIRRSPVYSYNRKIDLEKGIHKKEIGFVIERGAPDCIVNETRDAVNMYSISGILWKGMQELDGCLAAHAGRISEIESKESQLEHEIQNLNSQLARAYALLAAHGIRETISSEEEIKC